MRHLREMSPAQDRLPLPRVLAFAGVGMPLAAVGLPMAVFVIPMYAEQLGLGMTMTGLVFTLLRFWDLFTDPVMGWLVDTRPTRRGRIKHWLLLSIPVLALGAFFVFMPRGDTVHPLYLAFWLAVLWLGFTMLQTPHQSWVPMITSAYDERSRLFMWREIVSTATLLTLLILPFLVERSFGLDRRGQVMVMGIILLVGLPVSVALATRFVPDSPPPPDTQKIQFDWGELWRAFTDASILRIILIEIAVGLAIAGTAATFLFAAIWGFGLSNAIAPLVLLVFFVAGFAAMPFWTWLARRTEKHLALTAVCLFSCAAFFLYLPLSATGGGARLMLLGAALSGLGYGTPFILVRSMMADIIERENGRTGTNRAGLYYSLMSGAYKTGASLAVGIPYILLGVVVGFDPSGENNPEVVRGLMYVFVGVPVCAYLVAGLLASGYGLTRQQQSENAAKVSTPDS